MFPLKERAFPNNMGLRAVFCISHKLGLGRCRKLTAAGITRICEYYKKMKKLLAYILYILYNIHIPVVNKIETERIRENEKDEKSTRTGHGIDALTRSGGNPVFAALPSYDVIASRIGVSSSLNENDDIIVDGDLKLVRYLNTEKSIKTTI